MRPTAEEVLVRFNELVRNLEAAGLDQHPLVRELVDLADFVMTNLEQVKDEYRHFIAKQCSPDARHANKRVPAKEDRDSEQAGLVGSPVVHVSVSDAIADWLKNQPAHASRQDLVDRGQQLGFKVRSIDRAIAERKKAGRIAAPPSN